MLYFETLTADTPQPGRIAALRQTGLLDSESEEAFDRLSRLASRLLNTPLALLSLVDERRQFFKSAVGLPEPWATLRETPLTHSLCRLVVSTGEPLVVSDARTDPRVVENPAIGDLGIVAYLGVPLTLPGGETLGSFCVIDSQPREWSPEQITLLHELAHSALTEILLRETTREAEAHAQALTREREQFAQLVNDVDAIVWEADAQTWQFTFVSHRAEALLGYPVERWLNEDGFWVSLIHPEDRAQAVFTCSVATAAGRDHEFEYRAIAADGRIIWMRDLVRVITHKDGTPERLRGLMLDITAHKHAEEQLQLVVSSALCLLWEAVIELRVDGLHWEHRVPHEGAAQRFLPLTLKPGETYARAWKESRLPEDLPRIRALSEEACLGGKPRYTQEYRCRRADGEIRWLFEDVLIERLGPGRWRAVGVCSDITERMETEAALAKREQRFRSLIENASDLITILDADGTILYASPSVQRLLGYPPEDLLSANAFSILHPADRDQVLQRFALAGEGATAVPTVSAPYRIRTRDGSWRWFESTTTNLLHDPLVRGVVVNSRDVSDRRDTETQLRYISKHTNCILWLADVRETDGETLGWQMQLVDAETAQRVLPLDVAPDQHYFAAWYQSRLDADRAASDHYGNTRVRMGQSYSQEFRCRDSRGEIRWLHEDVQIETLAPGHWRAVGMATDITERKRAEEALRSSEARFRAIFDETAIGMALVTAAGELVESNRALQRILGISGEELGRLGIGQVTHPEDVERDFSLFRELAAGKRDSYQMDKRYVRSDGRVIWGRLTVSAVRDTDGSFQFAVGMGEDITDRRRAEERTTAFQELGEQLNSATAPQEAARIVVEMADRLLGWDCCWVELVDPELRNGKMVVAIDLIEGVRSEVPASDVAEGVSPLTLDAIREGAILILREPATLPDQRTPGHLFFGDMDRPSASLLCAPIRSGQRVIGAISIHSYTFHAYQERDAQTLQALADYCAGAFERTQAEATQQELQQQLLQAQKMEAVGRLAGGVAHDFNNMLAVINGYSDLILTRPDTPKPVRDPLSEIRRAGERAASLTRQLLAFSRKQLVQPEALDLADVVSSFRQMLHPLIGEDIRLVTRARAGSRCRADRGQIEQVLMNLAVNARDAMPQGGTLTIRVETVEVDGSRNLDRDGVPAGRYVLLTVADTGFGMDPDTLSHIYEPFYTTKPSGQGTGLGLATVYGIVEQNRGRISVTSAPEQGTTFRIYLPRLDEPQVEAPPEVTETAGAGNETVLVVEDEAMLRRLVGKVLRNHGYQVLEAADADEGLRACQEHPGHIELLLTDVVMPGRSGRELAVFAASRYPGMKVIYMSGYTDDAVVRHGVSAAEVHFLQKPFSPSDLAQTVRNVLDQ